MNSTWRYITSDTELWGEIVEGAFTKINVMNLGCWKPHVLASARVCVFVMGSCFVLPPLLIALTIIVCEL